MILWDKEKYSKLKNDRDIHFLEIEKLILEKKYVTILENPTRPSQKIFVINYNNYIHIVPYVIDEDKNIILKTAYASRKFNKIYQGK